MDNNEHGTNLAEVGTDCISRQAAIEDIRTMNPKDAQLDIKWVEMWLKQLPPVTSKQESGYWILGAQDRVNGFWAKCSACGKTSFGGGSFCRECGAKMKPRKGKE